MVRMVIFFGIGILAIGAVCFFTRLLAEEVPASQPAGSTKAFELPAMWEYSRAYISPEKREKDPSHAQKDPTAVFHDGKWHVFMTVKLLQSSIIEYCSFKKWEDADKAPRTLLRVCDSQYYCAPQVFYFAPQKKWYLIYQAGGMTKTKKEGAKKMMWVAYSTTSDISDPTSWTKVKPILDGGPNDPRVKGGLDYWIICDEKRAYLFFTTGNGTMWRMWTRLEDFPNGFGHCEKVLQAKIFEASHIYKLKGMEKYIALIEANPSGQRFFTVFTADKLDGKWTPLGVTPEKPFASWKNVRPAKGVEAWTDNISHGELIRESNDQTLTVDPEHLQFIFQGVLQEEKKGKGYGQWPWRIGVLTPVDRPTSQPEKVTE